MVEGQAMRLRLDTPHDEGMRAASPHFPLHWTETIGISAEVAEEMPMARPAPTAVPSPKQSGQSVELLLAEAAHDIRSPLATAQQILSDVGNRAQAGQALTSSDIQLLNAARQRLSQADRWAESILVVRNLQQRRNAGVRRRFYPHQWRNSVEPLLQEIAQKHSVQLEWLGWDRSLPKLYLDDSRLSRIVMNLAANAMEASEAGSRISIRVAWQGNVTPSLIMTIEDSGVGLDQSVMQEINATGTPDVGDGIEFQRGVGLGLRTAKLLATSMGGSLTAQLGSGGGSLLSLRLPVDNPQLLIRNWLAAHPLINHQNSASTISMHLITTAKIDVALVDQQLQQVAMLDDFVYRIAADRWLWIAASPISDHSTAPPTNLQAAVDRVARIGHQFSGEAGCKLDLIYRHICPARSAEMLRDLDSVYAPTLNLRIADQHSETLRRLTNDLCEQIAIQSDGKVPPVDELGKESCSVLKPLNASPNNRARIDQRASLPRPHALRSPAIKQSPQPSSPNSDADLEGATANAISEVVQQWHVIQRKLASLRSQHHAAGLPTPAGRSHHTGSPKRAAFPQAANLPDSAAAS